ncbi:hypothetical protein [Haloferula rosea]|uniref:Uncharacterized protein n=1 Tax=Haloferula rosea TaxID=490093 RepID=A0A934RCP4_9BACT|nr:hypothetical protein [Haloferula rosea]MBK1828727.1 hypothetical protein [Haloferula rosea]
MKSILTSIALLASSPSAFAGFDWQDHYTVEPIPLPQGVDPQVGGMTLTHDGKLAVCLHRGEVLIYDEDSQHWSEFANGLHEPLGIHAEKDGSILVVQRAELTRLVDEDGDGKADLHQVVCNDWGVSGNYHEFAFGLAKDSKGNYYISLGTASNGSGVRSIIRGEWNNTGGLTQDKFLYGGSHGSWTEKKQAVPRMYARVPYRGCILQISPDSRKAKVYATGLRTPNGLFMDENDQLWVSDNQGDWLGASKLHKIEEGAFYGHAASLLWSRNPPDVTPADLPPASLDAMRRKAAALLPQGECGNSITEMRVLRPSFAPIENPGALIIGEMNQPRMPVYLPDTVNGQPQGAIMHFLDTPAIGGGINRMVWSPDGKSLYVGKTHLSWPGKEGINRIRYNGHPFLQVQQFRLTASGFEIQTNGELTDVLKPDDYRIESFSLQYGPRYGSPKVDRSSETVAKVEKQGNSLIIHLKDKPRANRVYGIELPEQLSNEKLGPLSATRYWYTAHQVH